uniref:Uncharacterized protein n=1 Tax=Daphnia galeata TaxID=27404 RepID=A0A8J2S877_9CRUS|nr:unnamed protein product [Daphnia galeata]
MHLQGYHLGHIFGMQTCCNTHIYTKQIQNAYLIALGKISAAGYRCSNRRRKTASKRRECTNVPHFEMDFTADGVQIFNNSDKAECIPICVVVHSVSESSNRSLCEPIVLKIRSPIIIGVAHCKEKPNINPLFFKKLDPNNHDVTGRQFTVSIHCVIADWPMRSYLKRVKGHSGYWSCERCVQADEDFLSYCKSDNCPDEHINGLHDISPFIKLNHQMGKLSSLQLSQVDQRLALFKMCKPLEFDRHVRNLSKRANQ